MLGGLQSRYGLSGGGEDGAAQGWYTLLWHCNDEVDVPTTLMLFSCFLTVLLFDSGVGHMRLPDGIGLCLIVGGSSPLVCILLDVRNPRVAADGMGTLQEASYLPMWCWRYLSVGGYLTLRQGRVGCQGAMLFLYKQLPFEGW